MGRQVDPLCVACPQCGRPIGLKCHNWAGTNCAPHADRTRAARDALSPPKPAPKPAPGLFDDLADDQGDQTAGRGAGLFDDTNAED